MVIGAGPEAFVAVMRAEAARRAEIVARDGITADRATTDRTASSQQLARHQE